MLLLRASDAPAFGDDRAVFAALMATAALITLYWRRRDPARLARMRAWPLWRALAPLAATAAGAAGAPYLLAPRLGGWDAATAVVARLAIVPLGYALAVLFARLDPRGE